MQGKNRRILITMPAELLRQVDAVALAAHVSRCEFFRQAVRSALEKGIFPEMCGATEPYASQLESLSTLP